MVGVQEPITPSDKPPKRLLIAGASARSAAWSSSQAGIGIATIDLFGDQDLRSVCDSVQVLPSPDYPHGIRRLVRNAGPLDGWLYTGGLENYPQLVDQISEHVCLLGNPGSVLRQVRDPSWLMDQFDRANITCPRVMQDSTSHCDPSNSGLGTDKRWLRKPIRSAAGTRIRFADPRHSPNDDDSYFQDSYFQEFLDGPTFSAVYLAKPSDSGKTTAQLIGVTRLWTARDLDSKNTFATDSFRYVGSSGPVRLSAGLRNQWHRIGNCLAMNANLRGLFGVDGVVVNPEENPIVYPIEVNPRYTASIEIFERAMSGSLINAHVAACLGNRLNPVTTEFNGYWGKRIRFAETTVTVDEAIREVFSAPTLATSWILADIPFADIPFDDIPFDDNPFDDNPFDDGCGAGCSIMAGDPILTTIAESDSLMNVERALGFGPPRT